MWISMLAHHVCQSDVEEHSSGQSEDPVRRETVAGQDPKAHAQVAAAGRQEVKEQRLLDAHAGIQEDHKVSCRERNNHHQLN